MTGKNKNLLKLLTTKGIYFLPFLIASFYIFIFANIDRNSYPASAEDDQGLFQRIAGNILESRDFSGSVGHDKIFCPTRPPLYPYLIALTWRFTNTKSLLYVRAIQVVFYLLSLYLILKTSTNLAGGDTRYGIMSAIFASLIPHPAALTHVVLTESLAIFFLVLSVFLSVELRKKTNIVYLVLLGISLGLLNLQRPNFLLLPIILVGYIIFLSGKSKKEVFTSLVLVILTLVFTLLPWGMYRKIKIDSYTPSYTGVGFNVMLGIVERSPRLKKALLDEYSQMTGSNSNRKSYYVEMDKFLRSGAEIPIKCGGFTPYVTRLISLSMVTYVEAWHIDPAPADKVVLADAFLKKAALKWITKNPYEFLGSVFNNARNMVIGTDQPLVYQQLAGPVYWYSYMTKIFLCLGFLAALFSLLRAGQFNLAFFPIIIVSYIFIINSLMHAEPRYLVYAYLFMAMVIPSIVLDKKTSSPIYRKE
jgi:Dolichyl-phosphate-mannose-protein mannosyltransferase